MTNPGNSTNFTPPPYFIDALKNTRLLSHFTETGLQILACIAQEKSLPEQSPLWVENMIGESLYVIVEGSIQLSIRTPEGGERVLGLLGPGETLGEASILRAGPRLCTATALVPSRVLELGRRDVAQLQRTKPQACLKLMMSVVELVGQRMRDTDAEFRQFVQWRTGG